MRARVFAHLAVATLIVAGGVCQAQTSEPQKTTQPKPTWDFYAHYAKRVDAIKSAVAALPADTTGTIVLLGDSITEGHPAKQLNGMMVVNMGISGDKIDLPTSAGVIRRVELLKGAHPTDVFLMIGINDFGSGKPLAQAEADYKNLVEKIRATVPEAKLHIESLLPTSGRFAFHNKTVVDMNKFLKELADSKKLDFVDTHALYVDAKGELKADVTKDGLHLVPPAYDAWIAELQNHLAAAK